jgi:hypothetical protein
MFKKMKWPVLLLAGLMAFAGSAGAENLENKDFGYSLSLPEGFGTPIYEDGNALVYNGDGSARIQITVTPFAHLMNDGELAASRPAMEKEALKNIKKNGTKVIKSETIDAAGQSMFHVLSKEKGKEGTLTDQYFIFSETGMTTLSLTAKPSNFDGLKEVFESAAGKIQLSPGWKKTDIPGTSYSMALPRNMIIDDHPDERSGRRLIGASKLFLFSIASLPAGEDSSLPASLGTADDADQKAEEFLGEKIKKESSNPSEVQWKKAGVSGMPALCAEYDDAYGHGINYYVIKDGTCLSFEFSYDPKNQEAVLPLINTAMKSIDLGTAQEEQNGTNAADSAV